MYLGLWAVGAPHSTATLSSGRLRGLYGLRLVHRPNIFLSCFGLRAGQAIFFWLLGAANPNPSYTLYGNSVITTRDCTSICTVLSHPELYLGIYLLLLSICCTVFYHSLDIIKGNLCTFLNRTVY